MSESVRAVDRALDVLLCFSNQTPELTMTQIAERVGIHKSTAHRLLATLENKRFIQRDPETGIYRLGIRLLQMAYLTLEQNDLRHLAIPFMHQLCDLYDENIDLTVLDDTDVVFINILEGPQRVKLAAAVGQRLPAFATASGKAILGYLPENVVTGILDRGMPRLTSHTLISAKEFHEDLDSVRELGFAISEQELEEQINAVAAPIFDRDHNPVASIAVAGPAYRLTRERMIEMGPNVVATSQAISKEITLAADPLAKPLVKATTARRNG
ncbi:MAG: IclR family transcriptional regulator [Acidobacteriaceae bacterium]